MKWFLLFVVVSCATLGLAEPFIFSTLMSISRVTNITDSLMDNLQKIRERTASINEDIEKIAPAGVLGNFASNVIYSTSNTTADVINSATHVIDVTAKDMVAWVKNTSFTYLEKGSEMVLHQFQQYAVSHNMDNMTLPPIETKISGVQITASGGYFRSFASLFKQKSINVTVQGDQGISIGIPLSLGILDTGYTKFTAKLFFMSMSGSFRVKVQKNEIHVLLRLKATNSCALNVDRVEVVAMDGISVEFQSGCKSCGSMISQMSSGLANFMKRTLIKQVQEGIDKGIKNVLKADTFICAHFIKSA